ncbi:MAG: hypothetical protein ACRDO7_14750 [Nocardioidaceae bacterium]
MVAFAGMSNVSSGMNDEVAPTLFAHVLARRVHRAVRDEPAGAGAQRLEVVQDLADADGREQQAHGRHQDARACGAGAEGAAPARPCLAISWPSIGYDAGRLAGQTAAVRT